MPLVSRTRPKVGDVIEIPTSAGLAYAQYTHMHDQPPRYGALIRVIEGLYAYRPSKFSELVKLQQQFVTFFPLGVACNRKLVTIVANEEVPSRAQAFPTFRPSAVGKGGQRGPWWLWDGAKEWKVGNLTKEMERYPIRGIWNDTLLVSRIENGWRHEHDT